MGKLLCLVLPVVLVIAGCEFQTQAAKNEQDSLQGTWRLTRMVIDGKEVTDKRSNESYRLTFAGNRYTIEIEGRTVSTGTCAIDPVRNPKTIDITPSDGPDKGTSSPGIYKLDGRSLTFCINNNERPNQFVGSDTGALIVLTGPEK